MTDFTAAERAMLDRATVPAMRGGLARDIIAAASADAVRRTARGGWRRHGRVLLGAGALVIASATAAATGLLDRLPIRIPGITRTVATKVPTPTHAVRAERPRPAAARAVSLADITPPPTPLIDPSPTRQDLARERRAARIAAGLPVRRTLVQRAIAAKLRGLPPAERRAAIAEWRRIKALPPAERKLAVAKVRADFLATHPRMAKRFEQRLEARSAAVADGVRPPAAGAPRAIGQLTPDQRAERRQRLRDRRMQRRAQRWRDGIEEPAPPVGPAANNRDDPR